MEIDVTPDVKFENSDNNVSQCDENQPEEPQDHNKNTMSNSNCSLNDGKSSSNAHSKKIIKHALRQQAKRRRKTLQLLPATQQPCLE